MDLRIADRLRAAAAQTPPDRPALLAALDELAKKNVRYSVMHRLGVGRLLRKLAKDGGAGAGPEVTAKAQVRCDTCQRNTLLSTVPFYSVKALG